MPARTIDTFPIEGHPNLWFQRLDISTRALDEGGLQSEGFSFRSNFRSGSRAALENSDKGDAVTISNLITKDFEQDPESFIVRGNDPAALSKSQQRYFWAGALFTLAGSALIAAVQSLLRSH